MLRLLDKDGFPHVLQNTSNALPQIRQTSGYALGGIFLARARNYSCITYNASNADLYFVPVLSETFACAKRCAEDGCSKDAIFRRLSHLRANGGRDHFLLSPRQGWKEDLHPYWGVSFDDKRFGAATRFSAEEGAPYSWPVPATQAIFRSTPQASYVHISAESEWNDAPWRSEHPRLILVSWASNLVHNYGAAFSSQLNAMRSRLYRSCEAANDKRVCTHLPLSPTHVYKKFYDLKLVEQTSALYWNTTFCLQPIGDACTRKAIIDALLLGCIPVLFHPCQQLQWPWHWGSWLPRASMFFDLSVMSNGTASSSSGNGPSSGLPFDVVAELKRVPPVKIARMQRTIAEHAHCMHYAVPSSRESTSASRSSHHASNRSHSGHHVGKHLGDVPDAFDITLQGSWLVALDGNSSVTADGLPVRSLKMAEQTTEGNLVTGSWSVLCRRVPVGPEWRAPICRSMGQDLCELADSGSGGLSRSAVAAARA